VHTSGARGFDPAKAPLPSILFIVPELLPVPPTEGGAVEHWVHEVSRRLAGDGFTVSVISRPAAGEGDSRIRYLGVPWSRAGRWLLKIKQTSARHNPARALAKLGNVMGYALDVRRAMRDTRADIVYVHNDPLLASLLPKRPGQKLVLHMHNDHLTSSALGPLLRLALPRIDRILCVSAFITERARAALPRQAGKIQTVLNATDTALFRKYPADAGAETVSPAAGEPGPFQFLYVGRLTRDKGVHVLLEAFAAVHAACPGARLVIAGSSFFANAPKTSYEQGLALQAAPLSASIAFTGFIPHGALRFMYSQADAVVVPSIWQEPFGLVGLEAMSSEACVIATRVGGIPELVADGQTGLLVAPGDARALAAAMTRVMQDLGLRQRLGRAARRSVLERFDYSRLSADIATHFSELT